MFEIEKEVYGREGSSTFYFRDSTEDRELIHEIEYFGYETGYHFETIANYEKKHKLKARSEILDRFEEMRNEFKHEIERFRQRTGSKSETVSAHGDWINVLYDISGNQLLTHEIRKSCGIIATADDKKNR